MKNRTNLSVASSLDKSVSLNLKTSDNASVLQKIMIASLKTITFIATAITCSIILSHLGLMRAPAVTVAPAVVKNTQGSAQPTVKGPTQNNPNFATAPSWSQNFADPTYKSLDASSWNILIGPALNSNKEAQYYTDSQSNLRIENGALRIIATKDARYKDYKYESARIETQGRRSFLYGRIDVTAKVPKGVGTWPAIWMLPADEKYINLSPASDNFRYRNGGELDIVESVGFLPNTVFAVAHTQNDYMKSADGIGSFNQIVVASNDTTYNTYTMFWTPDNVSFAVNDRTYFTYVRQEKSDFKTWPFDVPFYLIINLAMGGSWGGQDTTHFPGNGIDDSALPASLDIQSIYYYPYLK